HFRTPPQGIIAFIKLSTDTSDPVTADPQVQLEAPITQYPTPGDPGVSALTSATLGFTPLTSDVSFSPQGLPCSYSGGTCSNNGFVYYFKDTRPAAKRPWAAVSISPAGRIKKWFWNGSAWSG